jgi:Ca2+-binding EF-hand superfamily protein
MTESEIEELVREADIDGDGEIDYKEFVRLILSSNI